MTPQGNNETNPECGTFCKATDLVSSKGQCRAKQRGMGEGLGEGLRHRKQSKREAYGEEEDGRGELRRPHLTAPIFSVAEEGKAISEIEEADLGRQLRRGQFVGTTERRGEGGVKECSCPASPIKITKRVCAEAPARSHVVF